MEKQQPTWREALKTTASDTTHTQLSDPVPPNEQWFVKLVAVKNETTANSTAIVYIDSGATPMFIAQMSVLSSDTWYSVVTEQWLREGERLKIDWTGVANGEVLDTHITGVKRVFK